jgi:hypothetical protein
VSDHHATHCRNCGKDLAELPQAQYCPQCGQETVLHPPTLWEFVHEFITHYVALEGALWRTLRTLLLKPGQLTREYFHGRRKHYVLPLRIYLTASFIFFLVVKVTGDGSAGITVSEGLTSEAAVMEHSASQPKTAQSTTPSASAVTAPAKAGPEVDSQAEAERDRYLQCAKPGANCSWADRIAGNFLSKAVGAGSPGFDWQSRLISKAPYAIFLMLPLFAGLLKLTYWGRRRPYGEHFVFSLHLHTFWFLVFLLVEVLPSGLAWLPLLTVPVYGCVALHTVYGGRWGPTLARASVLTVVYSLMLGAGAAALAVWLVLAG